MEPCNLPNEDFTMKSSKLNAKAEKEAGGDHDEKESNATMKNKLLLEIRALKLLITQTKCELQQTRFKDLHFEENFDITTILNAGCSLEIPDVQAELQNDLCCYAGFCCKKVKDKFMFSFESIHGDWLTNENWIQMYKDEEQWKLGEWVMPLGVDASAIFAKYSMNSDMDMKLFLKECKRLIDCHNRREREVKELKAFMNHMERHGCSVESNYGYTNVIIKLLTKPNVFPNDTRIILIYLVYNTDKTRPSKMHIDCEGENELSRDVRTELIKHLQHFKDLNLINAAKKTLTSPKSPFIWKDESIDDSIIEANVDKDDDMDKSLSKLLQKKATKKRGRPNNEETNESSNDKRGNDLSDDAEEASPVEQQVKKKPRLATVKEKKSVIKISRVKKIAATATKENRKTVPVCTLDDESEPRRASVIQSLPLKDRNDNVASSVSKNVSTGTTRKNQNVIKPSILNFFKPNTASTKSAPKSNEEMKYPQENIEQIENNRSKTVISVSTPKRRSGNMLLCSTPIPECVVVLSTIPEEENISAIEKVNATNLEKPVEAVDVETVDQDSDELDEDAMEDYCNNTALLKDLREVKYNNNPANKIPTKPVKRILKPSRGKNKNAKN